MGKKRSVQFMAFVMILVFSLSAATVYPGANQADASVSKSTNASTAQQNAILTSDCSSSTPSSGAYTVTLCFTAPASGSVVSGPVTVEVSATVTGTSPGIIRMVFYIDGADLLIDYQSPYSFVLPTTKWQDGDYTIAVEAVMRDGYVTTNQASLLLTFNNGINQPPVNNNTFTPSSGTTPPDGSPFVVVAAGDGADGERIRHGGRAAARASRTWPGSWG